MNSSNDRKFTPNVQEVIICLEEQSNLSLFEERRNKKHPEVPCSTITPEIFLENFATEEKIKHYQNEKIKIKNKQIKIYIIGHCVPGADQLTGSSANNKISIHYEALADKLVSFIGCQGTLNYKPEINLIACAAGSGDFNHLLKNGEYSFAAKLQQALANRGLDTSVVARTHIVGIQGNGSKVTRSLGISWEHSETRIVRLRKQPRSKVIFTANKDNKQIRQDAYYQDWKNASAAEKWRWQVLARLSVAQSRTKIQDKKDLLQQWIEFVSEKDVKDDAIYKMLKEELMNDGSILKENSGSIGKFFNLKTATYKEVEKLVLAHPLFLEEKETGLSLDLPQKTSLAS